MNPQTTFAHWLKHVDADTRAQMERMTDEQIATHFAAGLAFGTAGLRGIMLPGPGGVNGYTIAAATQGLANYLLANSNPPVGAGSTRPCTSVSAASLSVVIGYDSRNNSQSFARIAAKVLAGNGITAYIFDDMRPTAMVSHAVRKMSAAAGITITASHNPREYNGYKVYAADGTQLGLAQATAIAAQINAVDPFIDVKLCDESAIDTGLIRFMPHEVEEDYLASVHAEQVNRSVIAQAADKLRIVYTPLHGAGAVIVPDVLRRVGVRNLFTVAEQMAPNGDFPTVDSPNPEAFDNFRHGIKMAEKHDCNLVIATDPDADRVGVVARNENGEFVAITGNQMGALLLEYILTAYAESDTLPPRPYAVKTIVTSELAAAVCAYHGIKMYDLLTGFKYIGEVIAENDRSDGDSFILGFEESYGYLKGTYTRDKDAVVTTLLIVEMAAHYAMQGKTLLDALHELFERHGYFRESSINLAKRGPTAAADMAALMNGLRSAPPSALGGLKVLATRDYLTSIRTDHASGEQSKLTLPTSDVLYFELEGGNAVAIRPSGTEPKVKIYILARGDSSDRAAAIVTALEREVAAW